MLKIDHILPSAELQRYVEYFYQYESDDLISLEDHLLSDCGSINFLLSGHWQTPGTADALPAALLVGPLDRPQHIQVSGCIRVFGLILRPLGWLHLFGPTAEKYANQLTDLEAALPFRTRRLQQEIDGTAPMDELVKTVSAFFAGSFARTDNPKHAGVIEHIDAQLHAQPIHKVAALADAMEMSSRHLERVMPAAFGFGPKTVLRQRRFLRSLLSLMDSRGRPRNYCGSDDFHDQSHMIREYHQFAGVTPTQFFTQMDRHQTGIISSRSPVDALLRARLQPMIAQVGAMAPPEAAVVWA